MTTIYKVIALVSMLHCASVLAGPITYNVDFTVGDGGISGLITTDGTLGQLSPANFTSWNMIFDDGTDSFVMDTGNSTIFDSFGLEASATELVFGQYAGIDFPFVMLAALNFGDLFEEQGSFFVLNDQSSQEITYLISHELWIDGWPEPVFSHGVYMTTPFFTPIVFAKVTAPATLVLLMLGLAVLSYTHRKTLSSNESKLTKLVFTNGRLAGLPATIEICITGSVGGAPRGSLNDH